MILALNVLIIMMEKKFVSYLELYLHYKAKYTDHRHSTNNKEFNKKMAEVREKFLGEVHHMTEDDWHKRGS